MQRITRAAADADAAGVKAAISIAAERFPSDRRFAELAAHDTDAAFLAAARAGSSGVWHLSRIPRIAHFYFGGERTSFLRYLTIASFQRCNPDWEVRVYVPSRVTPPGCAPSWTSHEHYEGDHFFGRDYSRDLFALPGVQFSEVDFDAWPAIAAARETYKADLFRWHILSSVGGLYSDVDIVYHRPMTAASFNTVANRHADAGYCQHHEHHFIGFLLSAPGAPLYREIASAAPDAFDATRYQSIGASLLNARYPTDRSIDLAYPEQAHFNISMETVYTYDWRVVDQMHTQNGDPSVLSADAIGIHWYGGSSSSQQYNALVTHETVGRFGSVLDQVAARVTRSLHVAPGTTRSQVVRGAKPRFSVLVPTYNQAALLPAALESLLAQTFTDFEVIVVNDGSTDETRHVLDAYASAHPRIHAFHQPNGGVGVALNTALSHAEGEWVCWLSSDDLFEPTALATFVEAQQAYPAVRFFDANFSVLHESSGRLEPWPECRQLTGLPTADTQTLSLLRANHINGITICIDRRLVQSAGGWNVTYRYAQDYDLWLRLSVLTRVQFVDRRVAITRLHTGQDTHRFPMGGYWDSARAAHAFLRDRSFAELCPWADLASEASLMKIMRMALTVLADPSSFIYQGTGPNTVMLDRMAQWLRQPDATGRNQAIGRALCESIKKMSLLDPILRDAADRLVGPPLGPVATSDPIAMMRDRLRRSPDAPWADEMRRYLTAVSRNVAPTEVESAALSLDRTG